MTWADSDDVLAVIECGETDRAGLAPLRPHDLKHIGVALLAAAAVDPSEIARRAGHASVAFTYDRYGHLLPEVDKQAATKLESLRAAAQLP